MKEDTNLYLKNMFGRFKIVLLKFDPVRASTLMPLFGLCIWVVIQVKKQILMIANFWTLNFLVKENLRIPLRQICQRFKGYLW